MLIPPNPPRIISPEQLAKNLQKLELKEIKKTKAKAALAQELQEEKKLSFKPREWINLEGINLEERLKVSILTWNMLAQALVKRDLFPGSDMLRQKDRVPALMDEVLFYDCDIISLQEVDRLEDHLPRLSPLYDYSSFVGYENKSHGLLIAWKKDSFNKVGDVFTGRLDELPCFATETDKPSRAEIGLTRTTRNVFQFVALESKLVKGKGIIVGTTHLYWAPRHTAERVRQTGILFAQGRKFKESNPAWKDYEVIIAGDFNTQPNDLAYALLLQSSSIPLPNHALDLHHSTCVHQSVDLIYDSEFISIPIISDEPDPDHLVIRNGRPGLPSDGLLDLEGFKKLYRFNDLPPVISAYGLLSLNLSQFDGLRYCDRDPGVISVNGWQIEESKEVIEKRLEGTMEERIQRGDGEPIYTNFTPLWRCTLDYIFLLPNEGSRAEFTGILGLHQASEMEPGLPKKGIEGSDHVAIGAILYF